MKYLLIFLMFPPWIQAATPLEVISGDRFLIDLRYGTADNFLHQDVYSAFGLTQCWVQPELAQRLHQLEPTLRQTRLKIVFFDCFRPLEVQRAMWKLVPDRRYVADPATGSNHNRGSAVDIGLTDEEGQPLPMPTPFDTFSSQSAADYTCSAETQQSCVHRERLKSLMKEAGLVGLKSEWWHFQLPNAKRYPLIDALPS